MSTYSFLLALALFGASTASLDRVNCDFGLRAGNGICAYSNHPDNSASAWSINNGSPRISQKLDGPLKGLNNSAFLQFWQDAKLSSPTVKFSGSYCLSLDFYLQSPKSRSQSSEENGALLHIYGYQEDAATGRNRSYPLFTRNAKSSFVDRWQHYQKTVIFEEADYQITIEAKIQSPGAVALGNLKFEAGPCVVIDGNEKTCDFDVNWGADCNWLDIVNSPESPPHERLHVTSVEDHNPRSRNGDFSTRSKYGGFLAYSGYEDSQPEIRFGQFAPEDGRHCLSFAIKLSDSSSGAANVQVIEKALNSTVQNVLKSYDHRDRLNIFWHVKHVDIDPVVPINIVMKLFTGTVNLDSFKLIRGQCPPPMACTFQTDFCEWEESDLRNHITWLIGKGRLENPSVRHLANYERGLYADFSSDNRTAYTALRGPVVKQGTYCFRFDFQSHDVSAIELLLVDSERRRTALSHTSINQSGHSTGMANINTKGNFRVEFGVLRNGSPFRRTHIMPSFHLLKTELTKGECNSTTEFLFGNVNFHCFQTGHYIPMYRSCDGVIDCPMGEDEADHCHSGHACNSGGFPCRRRGHKFCLTDTDQLCNGEQDCDDAIDEDPRMCSADSFCDNYCLNDGTCQPQSFKCNCSGAFQGKRCESEK